MTHTPEPWEVVSRQKTNIIRCAVIGHCGISIVMGASDSDARRIVACVNACSGISTVNLEDNMPIKEGLRGLNDRIRNAECQRDELLAALTKVRDVLRSVPEMQHNKFDSLGIEVNAIIAKCEVQS